MDIDKVNLRNEVADIYNLLPIELQSKIKYYVLEHPVARIIKDDISRLRCDELYYFRDIHGKLFCKIDGRYFYAGEVFRRIKNRRKKIIQIIHPDGSIEDVDSESDDEYFDEVFQRIFNVSTSSSDEDGWLNN